ncbi:MAG: hypothetical protein Q9187_004652 [Circinaria calcarea]
MASPGRLSRLPLWLSRWFGYRTEAPRKISDLSNALWSFIGAFCGLSILAAVFGHTHYFIERHVPEVVASFGASTVLLYGAIESPLAQPRALIGGHIISSVIGVCTSKVFGLIPSEQRLESLRWLAGALSTATSIVLMEITATTHPPAGATALLAAINADVYNMGCDPLVNDAYARFGNDYQQYPTPIPHVLVRACNSTSGPIFAWSRRTRETPFYPQGIRSRSVRISYGCGNGLVPETSLFASLIKPHRGRPVATVYCLVS